MFDDGKLYLTRLRYFFLQPSQEGPSGFEYAGPDIVKGTLEGVCSLRNFPYQLAWVVSGPLSR